MADIGGERARLAAVGLNIEPRETWAPVHSYLSARNVETPARYLFLHISVHGHPRIGPSSSPGQEASAVRKIEAIGLGRGFPGISYNAVACPSGRLWEGQPLTRRGAHTVNDKATAGFTPKNLNVSARALVLPQEEVDAVTPAQIDAAARWGAALRLAGYARLTARWAGHRDVAAKACPGERAYELLGDLDDQTDWYTTHGLTGPADGDDELTPDDIAALVAALNASLGGKIDRQHSTTRAEVRTRTAAVAAALGTEGDELAAHIDKAVAAAFLSQMNLLRQVINEELAELEGGAGPSSGAVAEAVVATFAERLGDEAA